MRDAFRIDNGCRFLVLVIPNGCCDGRRRIVGGGLVTGGFRFVVVRGRVVFRIQFLHFGHADDGFRAGIEPQDIHMGEVNHIGITGGGIHEDGHVGKKCGDDQEAAFAVGGGREQHAFMDNRFGGGRLVRVLADINGTAVVGKLLVRGVVVYLGDIAVYHAGRTDTGHASGSQIDTLHTPSQGYLADSLTDKQLVGFV